MKTRRAILELDQALDGSSQADHIVLFYHAARCDGLEEALQRYSPDDSATDWADKIEALKEKS